MIRIFVVDDSAFVRKALTRVLSTDPTLKVVGEAASGDEALARIPRVAPDVVTLDVAMHGMNGLHTLRALLAWRPSLPVIMLSAHTRQGAEATLEALAIGAVDFIDKTSFNLMDLDGLGRELIERIRIWDPRRAPKPRAAPPVRRPSMATVLPHLSGVELCVVGASTGGPAAIQGILERLPADFPLPLAIVQHMPPGFTRPFAGRLNSLCRLRVAEATDGQVAEPGVALIAPAGMHLRLDKKLRAMLSSDPQTARHVPSVDVLMQSADQVRPGKVLGVLLTGMGEDGAEGMRRIRASGGVTIGESEATCVVYGMPRAAHLRGGVEHLLPLPEIAAALASAHGPRPFRGESPAESPAPP